jgi:phosphoenolpyruvate carboxylase
MAGLLGDTVASQEGPEAIAKVEQARRLARDYRRNGDEALAGQLAALVAGLSDDDLGLLVKAFTHYFGMANLAERIYAAEQADDGAESLASALARLKQEGLSAAQLSDLIGRALLMPVFTAHPTESRRRSTLKNLHRLTRQAVGLLEDPDRPLAPAERDALRRATLEEIVTLWQSDDVRRERPSVLVESRRSLFYFEESLYEAVPRVYRALEEALTQAYGPSEVARPCCASAPGSAATATAIPL